MAKKYIEADSIMQACYDRFLKVDNKAYAEIIGLIAAAKPADVQEVRHGYWIQMGYIEHTFLVSECSVCGQNTIDAGCYCPNCGAKMDEVEDGQI